MRRPVSADRAERNLENDSLQHITPPPARSGFTIVFIDWTHCVIRVDCFYIKNDFSLINYIFICTVILLYLEFVVCGLFTVSVDYHLSFISNRK